MIILCGAFFSALFDKFKHFMIVINSVKSKDHDLINTYLFYKTLLGMNFFDRNYLKSSNNFAADCTFFENSV